MASYRGTSVLVFLGFASIILGGSYVYVGSDTLFNFVAAYNASEANNGNLIPIGEFNTFGRGLAAQTADPLGSQNSIVSASNKLFVVNAGSNSATIYDVRTNGQLALRCEFNSRGTQPISIAYNAPYVYVLNNGGTENDASVAVFKLKEQVHECASHVQLVSLGVTQSKASQVSITPDGNRAVVLTKASGAFVYNVGGNGELSNGVNTPLTTNTPFSFAFESDNNDILWIVFAAGFVGSYSIQSSNELSSISGFVPTSQVASCWIVEQNNRIWIASAGSGTISTASVSQGTITESGSVPVVAGSGGTLSTPTDLLVTPDGQYLYVVQSNTATVGLFSVNPTSGLLTLLGSRGISNVVAGAQGIALV